MYRYLLVAALSVSSLAVAQSAPPAPAGVQAEAPARKAKKSVAAPAAPAKVKRSQEDIDLWAFSAANGIASANTIDAYKALPGFVSEKREELQPSIEGKEVRKFPQPTTLFFEGEVRIRLVDYGTQAFVSQVKVSSPSRELPDGLKVGSTREQVEAALGAPSRRTSVHCVYEGKTDTIRFLFANDIVTSVEIDRGA